MKPKGEVNEDKDKKDTPLEMTGYNPSNFREIKGKKEGTRIKGVITNLTDGILADFIDSKYAEEWQPLNRNAIEIKIEFKEKDSEGKDKTYYIRKLFVYALDHNNKVVFHEQSNLGRFLKQYETLPVKDLSVLCVVGNNGYFELLL